MSQTFFCDGTAEDKGTASRLIAGLSLLHNDVFELFRKAHKAAEDGKPLRLTPSQTKLADLCFGLCHCLVLKPDERR